MLEHGISKDAAVEAAAPSHRPSHRDLGCLFILSFTRRGVSYEMVIEEADRIGLQHRIMCECAEDMGVGADAAEGGDAVQRAEAELHLIEGYVPCGCCSSEPVYVFWV
mmetsp:Transcript_33104/g.104737  ORF Transcript_33104/g.104737 Transcript_33104/m.104737 type:complete len:108 (-) Transcript_33104:581-904(-)